MIVKNRLKEVLQELGIRSLVPTGTVLKEKLGGMTLHRFNKLLNNAGPKEMQLHESQLLKTWLGELTGRPTSALQMLEEQEGAGA